MVLHRLVASGDPYFVYPAITYPHKNHVTLIRAFARLAAEDSDVHLVLTGAIGPAESDVARTIEQASLAGRIIRTGRIERRHLDLMIERATALVFPSRFEGFGLPVVEALRLGCPVIAADATGLPEAVGGAGMLVEPDSVEGWHHAMRAALRATPTERAAGQTRGHARLAELSPDRMARRWLDLLAASVP